MSSQKNGVIYIVTSADRGVYLNAAIASAESVRAHSPHLGIHLYVDAPGMSRVEALEQNPFSSIGLIENPHYRSKVDYLLQSPFERTLYLDSDTRVVDDISEMFELLDRFDIALAQAHRRNFHRTSQVWRTDIPPSFPQYNGGVILYHNTPAVANLLQGWKEAFHEAGFAKDQVTLRELLWLSDLRLATLPPEYNIRYEKYLKIWEEREAKPKILHMAKYHNEDRIKRFQEKINRFFQKKFNKTIFKM